MILKSQQLSAIYSLLDLGNCLSFFTFTSHDQQQRHLEEYPASDSKQRTLSDFIN